MVCPDKRRPEENKDKILLAYTSQVGGTCHTFTHTDTHTHTHSGTHTYTHARTHAHTHAHTHMYSTNFKSCIVRYLAHTFTHT